MEKPSISAVEYDRTPMSETEVTVERLEFGKFCISSDGPIERNRENIPIEHSQLGWSAGFPKDLIPTCYPTKLGVVQEDGETLPHNNEHGSVLRPVVRDAQKEARQIFYRVKARAEDGEGKSGRRYTLARYLEVPGERINPLTMFAAMESLPLRGITRVAARDIASIDTELQEPELDYVAEAFLSEALIYILSGVAISITEEISERRFFTLVAAAYDRLPTALRPYLSAGWNVGSSYSGKLGISYTAHRAASTAHFSPATLTWSSPACVTIWISQEESVSNVFFEERLEPGRLFEKFVFDGEGFSEPSAERVSTVVGSLPHVDLPELPGWEDSGTVRIFRYPGFQARDQFAIRALTEWLETKTDIVPVVLNVRKLSFRANKLKAFSLILQALADPSSRSRADQALWLSITGKLPTPFTKLLEDARGSGAQRARLIAAISSADVANTLSVLENTPPEECEDLPDDVNRKLLEILSQSLRSPGDQTRSHSRLLLSPPAQYLEWVKQHALALMRALAFRKATPEKALDAIVEISGSEAIKTLRYFLTNDELTPEVESVLRRLEPDERDAFVETFNERWRQKNDSTALHREALLKWFSILKPEASSDALLRLVSGADLTDADVRDIADEIESDDVPESLVPALAELTLRRWSLLRVRISSEKGSVRWRRVTNLWPKPYAGVLGRSTGTDTPDLRILRTARQLRLDLTDLEYLKTIWFPFPQFREAAPLLWDWAMQLEPRIGVSPNAFDLCRHFVNGRLPDSDLSTEVFDDFVKLFRESGRGAIARSTLHEMWHFASWAWQLKLLLTLFSQENLQPTLYQLSLLIPHRKWLQQHLNATQTRFDRQGVFGIATELFHSLSSRSSAWRDDFVSCPLWAVFRGVPVSTLPPGALRTALRVYTQTDGRVGSLPEKILQEEIRLQNQAHLCLIFLRSYKDAASEDAAMKRALFEFVLPHYTERWSKPRFEATVASVGADMGLVGFERTDKYNDRFTGSMYELISQILNLCERKALTYMIKEFYKDKENASRDRNK